MKTTKKASYNHMKTSNLFVFLLISILFFCSGCNNSFFSDKSSAYHTAPDFSLHNDGTRLSAEEVQQYQDYIRSGVAVTKKDNSVTGTHTGLFSTVVKITLYNTKDKNLLLDCFSYLAEQETILSRTMPGSELFSINYFDNQLSNETSSEKNLIDDLSKKNSSQSRSIEISDSISSLIQEGQTYYELSEHHFDISIAPLTDLWNFSTDEPKVPKPEAIEELLPLVDSSKLQLEQNQLTKPDKMKLDFGAIAKGYLADQLAKYLESRGIKNAMINLGGNALAIGEKASNTPYKIGITKPFSESEMAGVMKVNNLSVVTSGVYERCFVEEGKLYHHILDAETGAPVENELLSVTIVCESSTRADALSTTCFLLGKEKGLALINELNKQENVYAMFLTGTYRPETKDADNLEYSYSDGFMEGTGFEQP